MAFFARFTERGQKALVTAQKEAAMMGRTYVGTEHLLLGWTLTALLAREVERRGALPFYGTSMSHIASQRVALRAGFVPAWTELYAEPVK